jgi:hypothetical protein
MLPNHAEVFMCTTQLCSQGVLFVSMPGNNNITLANIKLYNLILLIRFSGDAEMAQNAVRHIAVCLERRPNIQRAVAIASFINTSELLINSL